MNPLRANSNHKFRFAGKSPGLLKEKVGVPFPRVTAQKPGNAALEFQPVLYWCDFNRNVGAETRAAAFEAVANSRAKLENGDLTFLIRGFILINIGRLR